MKVVFAILFAAAAATAATVRIEDGGKTFVADVPPPGQTNFNERAGFYVIDTGEVVWTKPRRNTGTGKFATVTFTDGKTTRIELPVEGQLNHAAHHKAGSEVERIWIDHTGAIVSNYIARTRPKKLKSQKKKEGETAHYVRVVEEPATNGWTRIEADPPDKWRPPRMDAARRRRHRRNNASDRIREKMQ